jgi:hypothetical protein
VSEATMRQNSSLTAHACGQGMTLDRLEVDLRSAFEVLPRPPALPPFPFAIPDPEPFVPGLDNWLAI